MSGRRGATRKSARRPQRVGGRRRRLLLRLTGASVALAIAGLLLVAGRHLFLLPVERVVVSGEMKHVNREQVKAMINGSLRGGFLSQDLQTLREPLEAMPWIYRVVVRRQWPNSIEVRVIEQRAIARWGDGALLNHAGEVFSPDSMTGLPPLPRLAGPDGAHELMMRRYLQVQQGVREFGLEVDALEMDARGAVVARLTGGGELVFGRGALDKKLSRFRVLYGSRLAPRREELDRVDLRYSHGAAVAWRVAASQQEET